ncbi:MAG: carbohydrate ABC transporter permease [Cellulomonas sp.]|nr:carbohydrate ABC transporter permease [Cellulomonas sp.]
MTTTRAIPAAARSSSEGPVPPQVRTDRARGRRRMASSFTYAILVVIALVYIYPFLINVATSFKSESEATSDPLSLIPTSWSLAAYSRLFLRSDFPIWFTNSVIVTICVTAGRVFFNSLAGYALARVDFRGRGAVFAGLIAVMAVPGVVLLIPKFLVINQLGMYDTYAGMIIPLLSDAAGVFIMKNFFESIPRSVEEAAKLDGASTFRTFWSVVLPMARPALVTLVILSFQGSWNELSHFIVSAQGPELMTLTKGVAQLASGALSQGNQYPLKLAAAAIMTIPVAIMFFVFQKRIMNTSDGAEKG